MAVGAEKAAFRKHQPQAQPSLRFIQNGAKNKKENTSFTKRAREKKKHAGSNFHEGYVNVNSKTY